MIVHVYLQLLEYVTDWHILNHEDVMKEMNGPYIHKLTYISTNGQSIIIKVEGNNFIVEVFLQS